MIDFVIVDKQKPDSIAVMKNGERVGFINKLQREVSARPEEFWEAKLFRSHTLCVFVGEYENRLDTEKAVTAFSLTQNLSSH